MNDVASAFTVTVEADPFETGETTAYDVTFDWDGEASRAAFVFDISDGPGLSPASSSPAYGWVSWMNQPTIVLAWQHPERGEVRASTVEVEGLSQDDELTDDDWDAIARAVTLDVMSDAPGAPESVYLGNVEVDSGSLLLADPAYVLPDRERGKPGVDHGDVQAAVGHVARVAGGLGLVVGNFGGDGSFPVFGELEDGVMYKLTILFVEPPEDDE